MKGSAYVCSVMQITAEDWLAIHLGGEAGINYVWHVGSVCALGVTTWLNGLPEAANHTTNNENGTMIETHKVWVVSSWSFALLTPRRRLWALACNEKLFGVMR